MYLSTKFYDHSLGFSAAFRQWRAESHCRLLHGYSLAFKFIFAARDLDVRNWVVDFGGLKDVKQILEDNFDHTVVVAEDDPEMDWFREGERRGILRLVVLPSVGCEKYAEMIHCVVEQWLVDAGYKDRCVLVSTEVREHGANSAIFTRGAWRMDLGAEAPSWAQQSRKREAG